MKKKKFFLLLLVTVLLIGGIELYLNVYAGYDYQDTSVHVMDSNDNSTDYVNTRSVKVRFTYAKKDSNNDTEGVVYGFDASDVHDTKNNNSPVGSASAGSTPNPGPVEVNSTHWGVYHNMTLSSGDGWKTIYAKFRDNTGTDHWVNGPNINDSPSGGTIYRGQVFLDTTDPTLSFSPTSQSWTNQEVDVVIDPNDSGSGIDHYNCEYSSDGGSTYPNGYGGDITTGTHTSQLTGEGDRVIKVKVYDKAGNSKTFTSGHYYIDTTNPTGSIKINSGASYTSSTSVTLTLSGADSLSGVDKMMVSNSSSFSGASWETYSTSKSWTLSSSTGSNTVYVKFKDKAGNVSDSYSDSVTIDNTAPTGSISINSGATYATSTSATLTISATDSGSGVSQMMVSESSSFTGASWETYSTSKSWTLSSGDGSKTAYIKFKDAAGNASSSYNDSITLDTTAPTGSISINSGATYATSTSATLTISATDSGSGVSQMMVSESSSFTGASWETYSTSKSWTLSSGDGSKTAYIKFKDAAGNASSSYNDSITLDTTAPTVQSTDPASNATGIALSKTITVTFFESVAQSTAWSNITLKNGANAIAASNSISGSVLTINPDADFSESTTYTVTIPASAVKDNSGNNLASAYTFSFTTIPGNPIVTNVTSTMANGAYTTGKLIPITVTFHKNVNVTGTPRLKLETGTTDEYAVYSSGSGTNTLTFNYTVVSGDTSPDLDYVSNSALELNSGTIKDTTGSFTATLTLPNPGTSGSLGANKAIVIDTTPPTQPTINITSPSGYVTGTWTNQNIKFTVTPGTDSGSGVQKTEYSTDGGTSWSTYLSQITVSTEGTTVTKARTTDNAGNVSPMDTATLMIDKTAPTGTVTINSGASTTSSLNVSLEILDGSTGATDIMISNYSNYTTNGTTPCTWQSYSKTVWDPWTLIGGTGGTRTVYVKLKDAVGNVGTIPSASINFNIPVTIDSISVIGPRSYGDTAVINVTGTNMDSAAYRIYYVTSDSAPRVNTAADASDPGTGWQDGMLAQGVSPTDAANLSIAIPGTSLAKTMQDPATHKKWTYVVFKIWAQSPSGDTTQRFSQAYSINEVLSIDPDNYIGAVDFKQLSGSSWTSSPVDTFNDGDTVTYRLEFEAASPDKINGLKIDMKFNTQKQSSIELTVQSAVLQKQGTGSTFTSITPTPTVAVSKQSKNRYTIELGQDAVNAIKTGAANKKYAVQFTAKVSASGTGTVSILNDSRLKIKTDALSYMFTITPDKQGRDFSISTKVTR